MLTVVTGDITAEELGEVMKSLGLNPSDSELHDLVAEADVDNNGCIDFDGNVSYLAPPQTSTGVSTRTGQY